MTNQMTEGNVIVFVQLFFLQFWSCWLFKIHGSNFIQ